jgi:hypothetical protein
MTTPPNPKFSLKVHLSRRNMCVFVVALAIMFAPNSFKRLLESGYERITGFFSCKWTCITSVDDVEPRSPRAEEPNSNRLESDGWMLLANTIDDIARGAVTCKNATCHAQWRRAEKGAAQVLDSGGRLEVGVYGDGAGVSSERVNAIKHEYPGCADALAGSKYAQHIDRTRFLFLRGCVFAMDIASTRQANISDLIAHGRIVILPDLRADSFHTRRSIEIRGYGPRAN